MCVKSRRSVGCARNDGKVKTENGVQDESDKGMMYLLCHRVLHGGIFRALLSEKLCQVRPSKQSRTTSTLLSVQSKPFLFFISIERIAVSVAFVRQLMYALYIRVAAHTPHPCSSSQ